MRTLSAAIIALALSVVACGGDNNTATPSPSLAASPTTSATPPPSATPTLEPTQAPTPYPTLDLTAAPTPTPVPTPVPGPPLNLDSPTRIVYAAGSGAGYQPTWGELWIADLAGHTMRLTPEGAVANFVGLSGDPLSGPAVVYYVADATDDNATLYGRQLPDGQPQEVAHIRPWFSTNATGALSPDGRYIAYTDRYGIELLDLQTGQFQLIAAGGDRDKCFNPQPGDTLGVCSGFSNPAWSPEGSWLTATETFYESAAQVVIDPFSPGSLHAAGTYGGRWSPEGSSVCTSSDQEGGGLGLHISGAPDWQVHAYLADYTDQAGGPAYVGSCSWLDSHQLAIGLTAGNSPSYTFAALFDTTTGSVTRLSDNPPAEQCCWRNVIAAPDDGIIFTQYFLPNSNPNTTTPSQPEAIDVATGEKYSTLQQGDWIVAVVTQ